MKIGIASHQTINAFFKSDSGNTYVIILKNTVFPIRYNANKRYVYIAILPGKVIFFHHRCEHSCNSYYNINGITPVSYRRKFDFNILSDQTP